jgi:hypothetical protein
MRRCNSLPDLRARACAFEPAWLTGGYARRENRELRHLLSLLAPLSRCCVPLWRSSLLFTHILHREATRVAAIHRARGVMLRSGLHQLPAAVVAQSAPPADNPSWNMVYLRPLSPASSHRPTLRYATDRGAGWHGGGRGGARRFCVSEILRQQLRGGFKARVKTPNHAKPASDRPRGAPADCGEFDVRAVSETSARAEIMFVLWCSTSARGYLIISSFRSLRYAVNDNVFVFFARRNNVFAHLCHLGAGVSYVSEQELHAIETAFSGSAAVVGSSEESVLSRLGLGPGEQGAPHQVTLPRPLMMKWSGRHLIDRDDIELPAADGVYVGRA